MALTPASFPYLPLLHIISILLYGALFGAVIRNNPKAAINRYCGLVLICFMIWCLGKLMVHSPGTPASQAIFFRNVIIIGAWQMGACLLLFSLAVCGRDDLLGRKSVWLALFLIPSVSIGLQWYDNRLLEYVARPYGWGLVWKSSVWTVLLLSHVFITVLLSAVLCLRNSYTADQHKQRVQSRIVGICILIGLVIGYGTNIISPLLGWSIPDLAQNIGLVWMAGLVYAIIRHDFMGPTPAGVAGEILATMADSLILANGEGRIVAINGAGEKLLGVRESEVTGMEAGLFFPSLKSSFFTPSSTEPLVIKDSDDFAMGLDGRAHPVSLSVSQLPPERARAACIIIIARDISDRTDMLQSLQTSHDDLDKRVKQRTRELSQLNEQLLDEIEQRKLAARKLKQSEAMFRLISEQSLLGIVMLKDNKVIYANDAWADITEFSIEEMCRWEPKDFLMQVHPEDRAHMLEQAEKKQRGDEDYTESYDWRLITKTGRVRWISMYSRSVSFRDDIVDLATMIDISEQKNALLRLEESEEKYRLLVENGNDAIFILQDGIVKFANERTFAMAGYAREELLDKPFLDFIHPEDREAAFNRYQKRINSEEMRSNNSFRIRHKSGDYILIQTNSTTYTWEGAPATLNFARDLTLERKYESMMNHMQRLDAVSTMAGGIAHDLNNLLTPILGYAEFLVEDLAGNEQSCQHAGQIVSAAETAKEIVQQIMTFSNKKTVETQVVDIKRVVSESIRLVQVVLPPSITIEQQIDPDCGSVLADPTQLHQIVMNLITNSHRAMSPAGGTLQISLKRKDPDVEGGTFDSPCVLFSVADTGIGMDETTMSKIFDPYFSTKEQASGLGLSVVMAIVQSMKGHIDVWSKPGKGARFDIFLPLVEENDRAAQLPVAPSKTVTADKPFSILLIDDEVQVVGLYERMLMRSGYKVSSFTDPREAVETFHKNPPAYDLVLTDMSMPKMNGEEVVRSILATVPEIPVIVTTGFSDQFSKEDVDKLGIAAYLSKPVSKDFLLSTVREALA